MNFDNLSIHEGWNCFAMIGENFDRLSQAKSITYDVSDRRKKVLNIFAIEEVWYLSKYLGWVAVNINVEEMLNLCWVEGRVGLFVLCWQIAHFSLHIRIVNFCDGESCDFKTRAFSSQYFD